MSVPPAAVTLLAASAGTAFAVYRTRYVSWLPAMATGADSTRPARSPPPASTVKVRRNDRGIVDPPTCPPLLPRVVPRRAETLALDGPTGHQTGITAA